MVAKETPNHAVVDLVRRNIHKRENGFERDIKDNHIVKQHTRTFGFRCLVTKDCEGIGEEEIDLRMPRLKNCLCTCKGRNTREQ